MNKKYFKPVTPKTGGHVWIDDMTQFEGLDLQIVGTLPADEFNASGLIFHSHKSFLEYFILVRDMINEY